MVDLRVLKEKDPQLYDAYKKELTRQRQNIELIASENFASPAVLAAMGSHLTNKYAEGYPRARYYGGCECVDIAEDLARDRAKELFNAEHANVQPHCGANANTAVYLAFLKPGDTIMAMNLSHGGHLSHGSPVNISGKYFNIVPYGVDAATERIDYGEVENIALQSKPKLIVAGASAYARFIDYKRFRKIADKIGAILMVDMAHVAGLVAAGLHPSPVPYADAVTTTTHKTLRGPRGGLILCKKEWAKKIDSAIFPGSQGGPLMHIIGAKAVCFLEALSPEFKVYQQKVLDNAQTLAKTLIKEGVRLVSGGTDNHLILADLTGTGYTGKIMTETLDSIHITVNANTIPFDPLPPKVASGIRLGTPAATTRGMGEKEMVAIGNIVGRVIKEKESCLESCLKEVLSITQRFPLYEKDIIE